MRTYLKSKYNSNKAYTSPVCCMSSPYAGCYAGPLTSSPGARVPHYRQKHKNAAKSRFGPPVSAAPTDDRKGGATFDCMNRSLTDLLQPPESRSRTKHSAKAVQSEKHLGTRRKPIASSNQPQPSVSKAWTSKPVFKPFSLPSARKENSQVALEAFDPALLGATRSYSQGCSRLRPPSVEGAVAQGLRQKEYLSRDTLHSLLMQLPNTPASEPETSATAAQTGGQYYLPDRDPCCLLGKHCVSHAI